MTKSRKILQDTKFAVVLHNIRSVHNVGSIFRTADAVGVEKIYLCGITPAPHDRFGNIRKDFTKVALGAEKYLSWESAKSTARTIAALKKDGWKIFAIEQSKKSIPYFKLKVESKKSKVALVLGDEVRGVPPSILNLADKILEIPMRGAVVCNAGHPKNSGKGKESLNVAVSFGVVAFGLRFR
jgi:tRNA G18 (ribose-2'-O)-methylase SpoU